MTSDFFRVRASEISGLLSVPESSPNEISPVRVRVSALPKLELPLKHAAFERGLLRAKVSSLFLEALLSAQLQRVSQVLGMQQADLADFVTVKPASFPDQIHPFL